MNISTSSNNVSRTDIHRTNNNESRKSIEHHHIYGNNPLQSVSPSMPSGLSALEDNMLLQRPPPAMQGAAKDAANMVVVQAYKRQLAGQSTAAAKTITAKPKKQSDQYSKSKKKFQKMVEMDEGILFPMGGAVSIGGGPPAKPKRHKDHQYASNMTYETMTSQGGGGGQPDKATTMPPIFVETKLMIV